MSILDLRRHTVGSALLGMFAVVSVVSAEPYAVETSVGIPELEGRYTGGNGHAEVEVSTLALPPHLQQPALRVRVAASDAMWMSIVGEDTITVSKRSGLWSYVAVGSEIVATARVECDSGLSTQTVYYTPWLASSCPDWSCFNDPDAVLVLAWNPEIVQDFTPVLLGEIYVLSATLEAQGAEVPVADSSWGRLKRLYE